MRSVTPPSYRGHRRCGRGRRCRSAAILQRGRRVTEAVGKCPQGLPTPFVVDAAQRAALTAMREQTAGVRHADGRAPKPAWDPTWNLRPDLELNQGLLPSNADGGVDLRT